MRLLPYGSHAVLLELDDVAQVRAWQAAAADLPGIRDLVPGARTLLVLTTADRLAQVSAALQALTPPPVADRTGAVRTLDVHYDGPDLQTVAQRTGLPVEQVVRRHSAVTYLAAFAGFAPGFSYLSGLDPALHLPRRDAPRSRVPAGAVAIADCWSAVYPRASPGGWHLIGRTDAIMFDLTRADPALLPPGTRVRFRPR